MHMQTLNQWWISTLVFVHTKSGDSHFPEAIGWLWWETGPRLPKQSKAALPAWSEKMQREKAREAFLSHFWDKTWIMKEDMGRVGAEAAGVAEEEPFPSQLCLHFLCTEEVPRRTCSDLILAREGLPSWQVVLLWTRSHERKTKERGARTHMPVLIIAVENTHPHNRPNRKQGCSEQTSTSCECWGPIHRDPNQNPMFCLQNHYRHNSGDITTHLLIATRPYLS